MEPTWSDFNVDPKENPVLAHLPETAVRTLLAKAQRINKPAGALIMREGETSDAIFFLLSGEVSIQKAGVEIDRQGPGGVLGEMGVLTTQARTASVQCRTDVTILRVDADSFLAVVNHHLDSLRSLVQELVGKFRGSQGVRVRQEARIQTVMNTLSRMVSPEVVSRVLQQHTPEELLEGHAVEAVVLFLKLRGITALTGSLPPKDLLRTLNEHLAVFVRSIERHHGTIIAFLGDAIQATFNYPIIQGQPASAALSCCLECQQEMTVFQREQHARGHSCLDWGAGLCSGIVVTGAIGSESRFSFAVLGETVNLAERLEQLSRHYPTGVIVAETCIDWLSKDLAGRCVQIDRVQVKGSTAPLGIYAPSEMSSEVRATYQTALDHYLRGNFGEAARLGRRLGGTLPSFLAARCEDLAARRKYQWPGYFIWDAV